MGHLAFTREGTVRKGTPDAWLPLAAQVAAYARKFANRGDIVANVGPGIGGKYATACWAPLLADLDVNTDTCLPGIPPDRADFEDKVFQLGAMPFVGAVTHEAAHARWTACVPYHLIERRKQGYERWNQASIEIFIALEESRIERLAVLADPTKKDALAQCALGIVLNDFKVNNTLFGASISLALTVGRYAILSPEEVTRFRSLVEPHLPLDLMPRLEALIREYHALPVHEARFGEPSDAYYAAMFDITQRWLIAIRETAGAIEAEQRKAREAAEKREAARAARDEAATEDEDTRPEADEAPADEDAPEDEFEEYEPETEDQPAEADENDADDEGDSACEAPEEAAEAEAAPSPEPAAEGVPDAVEAVDDAPDEAEAVEAPEDAEDGPESDDLGAEDDLDAAEDEAVSEPSEDSGGEGDYDPSEGDTEVEDDEEAEVDTDVPVEGDEDADEDYDDDLDDEGEAESFSDDMNDEDFGDEDDPDTDEREYETPGDSDEGLGEREPDEPARDMREEQPDLRSGIPGEDEEDGEIVVIILIEDEDAEETAPETGGSLADEIRAVAGEAAMDREADAMDERKEEVAKQKIEAREADVSRREAAKSMAERRHGADSHGFAAFCDSHKQTPRNPEPGERIAANRLAAMLERITFHDRAVKKVDRVLPGGKLRPRAAVARAADRDRGGRAEVPIWRAKERRHTSETPVTVGIMTDVSGSMGGNEIPSAVLTYVVSQAVGTIEGKVATALFGSKGYLVNRAYERSPMVQPWNAPDGFEAFREAALLIDAELNLLDGDGARILIIFTDSQLVRAEHADYARAFMALCKQKNVAVVWCSYQETPSSNFGHGAILNLSGTAADIANTLGDTIVKEVSKIEASRN